MGNINCHICNSLVREDSKFITNDFLIELCTNCESKINNYSLESLPNYEYYLNQKTTGIKDLHFKYLKKINP